VQRIACVELSNNRKYAPYLDYDKALANGLPIATGVIEGTCRHLVEDRMNLTGARWSLTGAEAVLRLRALAAVSSVTPSPLAPNEFTDAPTQTACAMVPAPAQKVHKRTIASVVFTVILLREQMVIHSADFTTETEPAAIAFYGFVPSLG
jgi:hypothetical protein